MQYKILIIDDEAANLRLLERLFRGTYEVMTAISGDAALELLSLHDISLIISDQRMPGMTGIEFLKLAADMRPETVRIMLTGYSDAEALVEAINSGAVYKYITKPWVNEELLQTAKRALQHYESRRAQRQLQTRHERLQERLGALKEVLIRLTGEMVGFSDKSLADRAFRTRETAIQIGRCMQLGPGEVEPLGIAGFLFELSRLDEKFDGLAFLLELPEFEEAIDVLCSVNECFDGSGYPNGFANDEIPLGSRIVTVAHSYQHIASTTVDGFVRTDEEIFEELRMQSGSRLDPEIVESFCKQDLRIPIMTESRGIYAN